MIMQVLILNSDSLFWYLLEPYEDVFRYPLPNLIPTCNLTDMHHTTGRAILNLALACKQLFCIYGLLIARNLFFRCKSNGAFKYYTPTRLTITSEESLLYLPSSPTHLVFVNLCESIIVPTLPSSITHLYVGMNEVSLPLPPLLQIFSKDTVDEAIVNGFGPSLTHLVCETLNSTFLPPSITHLEVANFARLLNFPPRLIWVNLNDAPERQSPLPFPPSIQYITTSHLTVTKELFCLRRLKSLVLTPSANLKGDIISLTTYLPPSLTTLILPNSYPPIGSLCSLLSLRLLQFGECIPLNSNIFIPPLLTHLVLPDKFSPTNFDIPSSLTSLSCTTSFVLFTHKIPPSLTHLLLRRVFNENFINITFPPSLTHLTLQGPFNNLPPFPNNLIYLCLTSLPYHSEGAELTFPDSLTHLDIPHYSLQWNSFPPKLRHITIGRSKFPYPPFPPSLLSLVLTEQFDSPLNYIPPSLKVIEIYNDAYSHSFSLPPNLLTILVDDVESLVDGVIPPMCFVNSLEVLNM